MKFSHFSENIYHTKTPTQGKFVQSQFTVNEIYML